MRRYDADVLVIGAGPAGATAAYWLASWGFSVLMIERHSLPRYKPCGGALTQRTLQWLQPLDVSQVLEAWVTTLVLQSPDGDRFTVTFPRPLIATTMRDKLDTFLVDTALAIGAKIRTKEPVLRCEQHPERVEVITSKGNYAARVLVGADGANSMVANQLNLKPKRRAFSLVAELPPHALDRWMGGIHLHFPLGLSGYAWCFPKGNHLSAGLYTLRSHLPNWRPWLDRYLTDLALQDNCQEMEVRGHPIPLADRHTEFHKGAVLIVGDAAGLADPFTGEGIAWAVRSARMASIFVRLFLEHEETDALEEYTQAVRKEILPEMAVAIRFAFVLFSLPRLSFRRFLQHERVLQNFAKLLGGEVSYQTLWRKTLHKAFLLLRS